MRCGTSAGRRRSSSRSSSTTTRSSSTASRCSSRRMSCSPSSSRVNRFTGEDKRKDFEYYDPITTGDSTLSAVVQSVMAAEVGYHEVAFDYFVDALFVDLADRHGNTVDGLHVASAGGVWCALVNGFGGMRDHDGRLSFDPRLPDGWESLTFRVTWRGTRVRATLTPHGAHAGDGGRRAPGARRRPREDVCRRRARAGRHPAGRPRAAHPRDASASVRRPVGPGPTGAASRPASRRPFRSRVRSSRSRPAWSRQLAEPTAVGPD